jgi:hypothetical protein
MKNVMGRYSSGQGDRLIELYTTTKKPDEVKKYRDLREVAPLPWEKK